MLHENDIEKEVEEREPQVTSLDPNERKLARRKRIERRCENVRKQTGSDEGKLDEEELKGQIEVQVDKSTDVLKRFIREGEEYITNVSVAADAREVDRRDKEGIGRQKVIEQLENEAELSQTLFDDIAEKWSKIENYKDPLLINDEIQGQKEKCDMLIKQKEGIIALLREEIKTSERNFTRDQKKQMDDINILAQRIEKQVNYMRRAYSREYSIIEEVIQMERKKLLDMKNKKWEELFKKREHYEVVNSDKKFEQLNDHVLKMRKLRMDFEEKFRDTNISLENDIDSIKRELERIKALALLNSEKLDYNYQILKKREDENIIIKGQQKRRINKLQDVINDLRKTIRDYEMNTNNLIKKLGDSIKKLHHDIMLVEEKADHFAIVNNDKFHKVWDLNKSKCMGVLNRIMETDKILYEQQMGIEWTPPVFHILKMKHLPSYKEALRAKEEFAVTQSFVSISTSTTGREKKTEALSTKSTTELDGNPIYRKLLKYVLTHVSDKTGFLTEKRLKELLQPYMDDQKTLVRLDNVFASTLDEDLACKMLDVPSSK